MVPVLVGLLETTVAEGGGAVEVKLGRAGELCAVDMNEDTGSSLVTLLEAVDPMDDAKGVPATLLAVVVPRDEANGELATLLAAVVPIEDEKGGFPALLAGVVPIEGAKGIPVTLLSAAVSTDDDKGVFVIPPAAVTVVTEPADEPWLFTVCDGLEVVDSRRGLETAALALALPLEERSFEPISAVEASSELLLVVIESSKVPGPKELLGRVDTWFEALYKELWVLYGVWV